MFVHILYHKVNCTSLLAFSIIKTKSPHMNLSLVTVVYSITTCALTIHCTIRHITHNRARCSHISIYLCNLQWLNRVAML